MLTVHRFSQIAIVEVLGKAPVLSSELEAKVERCLREKFNQLKSWATSLSIVA